MHACIYENDNIMLKYHLVEPEQEGGTMNPNYQGNERVWTLYVKHEGYECLMIGAAPNGIASALLTCVFFDDFEESHEQDPSYASWEQVAYVPFPSKSDFLSHLANS